MFNQYKNPQAGQLQTLFGFLDVFGGYSRRTQDSFLPSIPFPSPQPSPQGPKERENLTSPVREASDHSLIGDKCSWVIFQAPASLTNTSVERSFLWTT